MLLDSPTRISSSVYHLVHGFSAAIRTQFSSQVAVVVDNSPGRSSCTAVRNQSVNNFGTVYGLGKESKDFDCGEICFLGKWYGTWRRCVAKTRSWSVCFAYGPCHGEGESPKRRTRSCNKVMLVDEELCNEKASRTALKASSNLSAHVCRNCRNEGIFARNPAATPCLGPQQGRYAHWPKRKLTLLSCSQRRPPTPVDLYQRLRTSNRSTCF